MSGAALRHRAQVAPAAASGAAGPAAGGRRGHLVRRPLSPWVLHIGLALTYGALLWVVYSSFRWLPEPRPASAPAREFSEARARKHLEAITGFGVRTAGSVANEVHTPAYLVRELQRLASLRDEGRNPHLEVEVDLQRPSG